MRSLLCAASLLFLLSGCGTILHELQPHRLWRLNYTDTPGRSDAAFFSVSDDLHPEIPGRPGDDGTTPSGDSR